MQNADLTWAQDLGAVTELLSGEFFRWFGRSTSHQLWSSAMVVTPTVRGMFGLEWDADSNTLTVTPNLPAEWDRAQMTGIPLRNAHVGIVLQRNGAILSVRLIADVSGIKLATRAPGARLERGQLNIPLPPVEVGISHGLPTPGSVTSQLKVIDQQEFSHSLRLRLSAPANSHQSMFLRLNDPKLHLRSEGAEIGGESLNVQFPSGSGYVEKAVLLSW